MTTFEALSERRRSYVKIAQENGFEEGLRKLLADLYVDKAHFIYELLQNAEDAGAKEVTFDLRTDGLHVEHDGTRPFDLRDIESITGIGQSTKPDDTTAIGKFGVGFKAVFAYTQTPLIHSGGLSFEIHDLFVPVIIPNPTTTTKTKFWFPFDRVDKPAEVAVEEVATALRDIAPTTLLFLNSIQMIGCYLPDGDERLLQRRQVDEHVIEIDSVNENDGASFWYRITSDVVIDGQQLAIAAAFALEENTSEKQQKKQFTVSPIDGQVFIYFPAVKETSGLKFHVHAPFASTVARESVNEKPENDRLIEGIAALVAESLPDMRDRGLITDGLLAALPNQHDDLPARFDVVREHILRAFCNEPLTPKMGGGHAPSTLLVRSEPHIRSSLTIADSQLLLDLDGNTEGRLVGWLPSREGRADDLLGSLFAYALGRAELGSRLALVAKAYDEQKNSELYRRHIDEDEFKELFQRLVDDDLVEVLATWRGWITSKPEDWMKKFYSLLGKLTQESHNPSNPIDTEGRNFLTGLRSAPLLRVQDGTSVRHVSAKEAFLPLARGLHSNGLVIDTLVGFDNSDRRTNLRDFYELAKVKQWNAAAQLDQTFESYRGNPAEITEQHLEDLRTLERLIDEKLVSPTTYQGRRILLGVDSNGKRRWTSPNRLFLDEPFHTTGLAALYESDHYQAKPEAILQQPRRLDPSYQATEFSVSPLAVKLLVIGGLEVAPTKIERNPRFQRIWVDRENQNKVSVDWNIQHLDTILAVGDESLLRELWRVVATAPAMTTDAIYRSNGSSARHVVPSQFLNWLQSNPWILDRDENLRLPEEISESELAEGLHLPKNSVLLERAGFGRKAAVDAKKQEETSALANELGFESLEEIVNLGRIRKLNPEKFRATYEDFEGEIKLPEASTSVPEKRARRAGEISAGAPIRQYEQQLRTVHVQVPGHLSAARGYLQAHYSNVDHVMFCQVCSKPMPFKIHGQFYFEAVQFVTDSRRELHENRLALCPICAAKYRHARETSSADLRDDLVTQTIGVQGSISVDVVLAGEPAKVRFVGKHAIDLQAALGATTGEPLTDKDPEGFET